MHATRSESPVARLALITAVVASLLFVTFLVVSTSRAAFTDTTDNATNTVTAGSVTLLDDDLGSLLFNVADMVPSDVLAECIEVTYNGTVMPASPIRLYRNAPITGTGLDSYLNLVIEEGPGGVYGSCAAFVPASTIFASAPLQTFGATHTAWASGIDTGWTPVATGETRSYRLTLTLQDNNLAQALNADFGFTWEAQS